MTAMTLVMEPRNRQNNLPFAHFSQLFSLQLTCGSGSLNKPTDRRLREGITQAQMPGVGPAVHLSGRNLSANIFIRRRRFGGLLHRWRTVTILIDGWRRILGQTSHHCLILSILLSVLRWKIRRAIVGDIVKAVGLLL